MSIKVLAFRRGEATALTAPSETPTGLCASAPLRSLLGLSPQAAARRSWAAPLWPVPAQLCRAIREQRTHIVLAIPTLVLHPVRE